MPYRSFFVCLLLLGGLSSCALHDASAMFTPYQRAMRYYASKNYGAARRLFEETLPLLSGKEAEATACFCQAYCSFYTKQYLESADRFEYFYRTFSRDPRVEEAMYMQGRALCAGSPHVKLDQTLTQLAIVALRDYLSTYPKGAYAVEADVQLREMNEKMALKILNTAKLYYRISRYQAVLVTLEDFQKDFPDSAYSEEVAYIKARAQYRHFLGETKKTKKKQRKRNSRKRLALAPLASPMYAVEEPTFCGPMHISEAYTAGVGGYCDLFALQSRKKQVAERYG